MQSALRSAAERPWFAALIALAASMAVLSYIQSPVYLADPDSFYHTGLTVMMRDQGLVREFPWTTASYYSQVFIDHHLLYHVLLLPFINLWEDPFAGARLATIIFASLSVTAAVYALVRWRCPYWGVGLVLLLTSAPFLFRLSLVKAPSLAVGVAVIAYILVVERKLGWLFWFSWFWVWFYSSWPLLLIMVGIFIAVDGLNKARAGTLAVVTRWFSKENLELMGTSVLGLLAGLLVNPYFPKNVSYLKQLLGMAIQPFQGQVAVGGEWYPYHPADLPAFVAYPLLIWFVGTVVAFLTFKKQTHLSRATWVAAVVFLAYTLRARRQVEYLVPWLVLSSALNFRDSGLAHYTWIQTKQSLSSWIPGWLKLKSVKYMIAAYLLVAVPWGLGRGIFSVRQGLASGFTKNTLAGTSAWLAGNSQPGDIVFQSDWGSFPMLWYHNQKNFYLTGLDQTFMYRYSPDLYRQWYSVAQGNWRNVSKVAGDIFKARYVVVEKRTPAMLVWTNRDKGLNKVYEDIEAIVYEVVR